MNTLQRHRRVWPSAAGYDALASDANDPNARKAIGLWAERQWPFIVRRREENESFDGSLAIGLALPSSLGKHRLKLRLPYGDIASHRAPLTLGEVVARAKPKLRHTLMPLALAAARERITLRVFGSAAWQVQTDLDYLHRDSDLDLVIEPCTLSDIDLSIGLLERMQARVAMRLDGEIVFPGGDAVAWREWAKVHKADRVLVKNVDRVALMERDELLCRFDRCKAVA